MIIIGKTKIVYFRELFSDIFVPFLLLSVVSETQPDQMCKPSAEQPVVAESSSGPAILQATKGQCSVQEQ